MLEKFPPLQNFIDNLRVKFPRFDHFCFFWHVLLTNFHKKYPLLVYQMAKVGSSTIYDSLIAAKLNYHVYHIHYLTNAMHRVLEKEHTESFHKLPPHVSIGKALKIKVKKDFHKLPWKIIALVRDPIKREISSCFEISYLFQKELQDKQGHWSAEKIKKFIEDGFSNFNEDTNFCCNWFDFELKAVFGIDVYDYPFPKEQGYQIIHKENVELLVFRLEDLNATFAKAIKEFLGPGNEVPLIQTNLAKEKDYYETYKVVSSSLRLPEDLSRKVYNSKFVRHFYSDQSREKMAQQWIR